MKKVLIITYYWPPGSGAGVQRWLKFVKYLPQYGWEPLVLTVDPSYAAYPAVDQTLEDDIPPGTKIFRTRAVDYFTLLRKNNTKLPSAGFASGDENSFKGKLLRFIRGNFFIPDPRRGWNGYAFRKACEIISKEEIDHVITTSPPHSTQLIGLKLKKRFPQLRWMADLRDPWTDIYYYKKFYHTLPAAIADRHFEKEVLRNADKLITVGKSLKSIFSSKAEGIENKISVITNGYDDDDFSGYMPLKPERFTITYTGTLSDHYPVYGFLKALRSIADTGTDFRLRFVGMVSSGTRRSILSITGYDKVEFIPYSKHSEAIHYLAESSALLLIIPDHSSNKSIITGKLFEYLASGKPIICLGPEDGDAATIIRETVSGKSFTYSDSAGMEEYLRVLLNVSEIKPVEVNKYSRKYLTSLLSDTLNS